jgi:hypothetical protein
VGLSGFEWVGLGLTTVVGIWYGVWSIILFVTDFSKSPQCTS